MLRILPDKFGWPTTGTEYRPGLVGLDFAIGREVTVRDYFLGAVTGRLDSCDHVAARSMRVTLVLADGKPYTMSLSYASEIEVHA